MKILVGLKRAVDYNVRVQVKPDGSGVVTDGVKMSINPFDEIALEEALRLRESGKADEVVDETAWEEATELASAVYWGRADDPSGGALWYHATYVDPRWRKSMVEGPTIGQHRFYLGPQKR